VNRYGYSVLSGLSSRPQVRGTRGLYSEPNGQGDHLRDDRYTSKPPNRQNTGIFIVGHGCDSCMTPKKTAQKERVSDYRHHDSKRTNNPPAGIVHEYEPQTRETKTYDYDPHLDPQILWTGKTEGTSFDIDVVSLHIHERISTKAILDAVKKPAPVQLTVFGETALPADQQIEFYQHDVGWTNRLILGDSLLVMNSLLVKEAMAGRIQMIYLDPPYGINYSSNFQPRMDQPDVREQDSDLTREPEQIKAYRDTWKLGVHSYLSYLRDRLLVARELLSQSGSIFVQIGHENAHLVRCLLDETFGSNNFLGEIAFRKTSVKRSAFLPYTHDYLLWYGKDRVNTKYRQLYTQKEHGETGARWYDYALDSDGRFRRLTATEKSGSGITQDMRLASVTAVMTKGNDPGRQQPVTLGGQNYVAPAGRQWKTNAKGMERLATAGRLLAHGRTLKLIRYIDDNPMTGLSNIWNDTWAAGFTEAKLYAVQTSKKVVERCILMTTDPGDLVLDPTCGSGTTAVCAEGLGRRWVTCDTSRVAVAIARQRIMTAKFDYYQLLDPARGPSGGFAYGEFSYVTLKSIAMNSEIDRIHGEYEKAIADSFLKLNTETGLALQEWEVPPDGDKDWSRKAREAHARLLAVKREMFQKIEHSIRLKADKEALYDCPKKTANVVRVSGPFTVEAIPLPTAEDPSQLAPDLDRTEHKGEQRRGEDYFSTMISLLRQQGSLVFPGSREMKVQSVKPLNLGLLHAEGETERNGETLRIAFSFGPQHGPVTSLQVREAVPTAKVNAFDVLVFAGFGFDPEAQALLQKTPVEKLEILFASISPEVLVGDLLKTTRASQLFAVFGQPDVEVKVSSGEKYTAELRGVDIYDPVVGKVFSSQGREAAAWFLDTDYDGMTFHICQAFFPGGKKAWAALQKALRTRIDHKAFQTMRGVVSFPFALGEHKRIAVKVIDFRGNEIMTLVNLEEMPTV